MDGKMFGFNMRMSRFPNVVGAVDCTQIKIQAPTRFEEAYVSRKGGHNLNVQVGCSERMDKCFGSTST